MIFCILMVIMWVAAILCFIAHDEDYLIGSIFCTIVFTCMLFFSVAARFEAKEEARQIKTVIENSEYYTYAEIESINRRLLDIQSNQDTIFSFHYNDDELRNLKPILLSTNDTSKVNTNE